VSDPAAVERASATVRAALSASGLDWTDLGGGRYTVDLPGERKLKTTCRLEVGAQSLGVHAFVARRPDENHERVYRWLLERNLRMYGVAFAVDHAGDIHLDGRLPHAAVTVEELDRLRRDLRAAIRAAIRQGGVHTGRFVRARGREGACPREGHPLERATVGGRTTYWCPACQV
jgi:hypothetical protein